MLTKCKDLKTLANVSQRTEILDFPLPFHIAVALTSDTDVRTAFKSPKTTLRKKRPPFGDPETRQRITIRHVQILSKLLLYNNAPHNFVGNA